MNRLLPVCSCLLLPLAVAAAQTDGPDIEIRSGRVIATAADYEMDGTMWAAASMSGDSGVFVYNSTDHGLHWTLRFRVRQANTTFGRIGLVAGHGDSGFVHILLLDTANNGDLIDARFDRTGAVFDVFNVCVGPDTVRDFAVCRDYIGAEHWLYAAVTNPEPGAGYRSLRFLRSSTYGRYWYVTDSFATQMYDPHLSAGAGNYIYFSAWNQWWGNSVQIWRNRYFLSAGAWDIGFCLADSEGLADPVVAAAFTLPESTATVWCAWSQDYQNSGDWDIKCSFSTDGGRTWSAPGFLAGSSSEDEGFPDLRNYTSPGNQYINASYISDDNVYRKVFRRFAHAASPDLWSDTLRINSGNAGTGREVRPKLCYTPGGPFTGAGCVFVGAGLDGCWWNAPYPVDVEAPEQATAGMRVDVRPRVGRGPFLVMGRGPAKFAVHDRAGRLVRTLQVDTDGRATWDGRDGEGRMLGDGVYFVGEQAGGRLQRRKVVFSH